MQAKPDNHPDSKRGRTRDKLLISAQTLLMDHSAANLGLRQIATHAGVVHATFYNYYPDVPALIADLAALLGASHAAAIAGLFQGTHDPALRFARITRHTLRIVALQPGYGRLMFDVGLPPDQLGGSMRMGLKFDLGQGAARGHFAIADLELATSVIAGAISGLALDLHRGHLRPETIDPATDVLLRHLGVEPAEANRLAFEPITFPPIPEMPMRWLALPAALAAAQQWQSTPISPAED